MAHPVLTSERLTLETAYHLPDAVARFQVMFNSDQPPAVTLSNGPDAQLPLTEDQVALHLWRRSCGRVRVRGRWSTP
ncbi:MAG: hypothetical protein ACREOA_07315 [Candidatus Dormibacteria bacterium]